MKKNLQAHAKVYSLILAQLFQSQGLSGQLKSATRGARHLSLGVRLAKPDTVTKAIALSEPLALAAKVETVLSQRVTGLVVYQFQLQHSFWQTYTRADVEGLTVGLAEQRRPIQFSFDDAPHALFAGASGSGKTEAIKSTLLGLVETYTPDELGLILIDTDDELEDFTNAAHLLLPIATEMKAADNALSYAYQQFVRRKAESIKNAKTVVIVIDEISDLTGNKVNMAKLKSIAKQGRKYNIHLLIGNQKPRQKELPDILDNLLNRFVGQVDNAQTSAMLTGHSGLEAHKLTGKGDFLHVVNAQVERFQVALATTADFECIERRDVKPVVVVAKPENAPEASTESTNTVRGGYKPLVIEAAPLAYYMHNQALSIRGAKEAIGFSKSRHNFYKQFLASVKAEYNRLRRLAQ